MAETLPAKQGTRRELSDLPFDWERTTAPEMPFSLPVSVRLNVTPDSLRIHAVREGTIGELMGMNTDVDATVVFERADILSVEVFLMPDVSDDADPRWVENDLSLVILHHRDPADVEPFFESVFSSWKAYWPKALVKILKERGGIESKVTQEDEKSRKLRLTRESVK
jgi:hypothetical protein